MEIAKSITDDTHPQRTGSCLSEINGFGYIKNWSFSLEYSVEFFNFPKNAEPFILEQKLISETLQNLAKIIEVTEIHLFSKIKGIRVYEKFENLTFLKFATSKSENLPSEKNFGIQIWLFLVAFVL